MDNKGIFKEALEDHTYYELFTDRFAGNFGHCTELGYHILAENIAKKIIENTFEK